MIADPLRWVAVILAATLSGCCGASIVLSIARHGQRLRILGTGVLAIGLTGGQLNALGRGYTTWTWLLTLGLALSVVGMVMHLQERWTP